MIEDPAHKHRLMRRDWLVLGVILALTVPSLVLGIDVRLSTHTMENLAVVTSQETFLRLAEDPAAGLIVSTNDGQPRLEKPPMVVWLNLLAWSDLDPATATPQQLIFRARCVTVALSAMMLASIFLLGRSLGDWRFAALATMSVASTFFFQRQARTASYDMHYVAWTSTAVALGIWAMNPLGAAPSLARRLAGWGGYAVCLAAAVMSKNPLPYLLGLPPLIAAVVLLSERRRTDALWLIAAILCSAIPVAAWYWHVFATYPRLAERVLAREMRQPRLDYQPLWYYLGVFVLVVPWTAWLVGSLIEPFRLQRGPRRCAAMLAVFWFALIFVGMSIPAAKQQRYILGILPAVGLLLAMFIRQHNERARGEDGAQGRDDPVFRVLFAALWIALGVASIATVWFFTAQEGYARFESHLMDDAQRVVAPLSLSASVVLAIGLLVVCAFGWRWHAHQPWRSAMASGVWMLVIMTVFWNQEAREDEARLRAYVDETARIRAIVGEAPVRSLRWTRADEAWQLNEEFRIYFGRLIHRIWPDDVDQWLDKVTGEAFVLTRPDPQRARFLQQRGFTMVDHAQVDKDDREELWRRAG